MNLKIEKHCSECGKVIECKLKNGVKPPRVDFPEVWGDAEILAITPEDIQLPKGWIDGFYEHELIDEGRVLLYTGNGALCPDCVKALKARQISEQEFTKRLVGAI